MWGNPYTSGRLEESHLIEDSLKCDLARLVGA